LSAARPNGPASTLLPRTLPLRPKGTPQADILVHGTPHALLQARYRSNRPTSRLRNPGEAV